LLFSVATTGYILIAMQLEEHDLVAALGDRYRDYRTRVPMIIPGMRHHSSVPDTTVRPA
jgi:protein-S-isoprenylcysteine O-methyltransferase Ste14